MRKLFTILVAVLFTASVFLPKQASAQAPEKISYQAVIRDSSNALVTNTDIGMEINIRQGSISGTVVYTETQTPTTNANGLVSIEIGGGAGFNAIDWSAGTYFIETKTAVVLPLTTYTITGASQLLSVPYALHAKTAETVSGGITETDPAVAANFDFTGAATGDLLQFDGTKWVKVTPNYLTSETDPSVPAGTQTGEMQYWNGSEWLTVAAGQTGQALTFINGVPVWLGTPITEGVVANPTTGKIWMDRNLGASQVATSSTDANAYGYLYQWGRGTDGHQIRTSGSIGTFANSDTPGHASFITSDGGDHDWRVPNNDNLWQGVNGINNPCPSGFRLPTYSELVSESATWSSSNAAGAYASALKLTLGGIRYCSTGALASVGSIGCYWSSTISGTLSKSIRFSSIDIYPSSSDIYRAQGNSVRCIKD